MSSSTQEMNTSSDATNSKSTYDKVIYTQNFKDNSLDDSFST